MFEQATKKHLRFESAMGLLTTEDLWDLPLIRTDGGASLNNVAVAISHELKDCDSETFVDATSTVMSKKREELSLKLDVVKHIISVKQEERERNHAARERAQKKQELLAALAKVEGRELESKSSDELRAMIDSL